MIWSEPQNGMNIFPCNGLCIETRILSFASSTLIPLSLWEKQLLFYPDRQSFSIFWHWILGQVTFFDFLQDNASYHTCDSDAPKANANVKDMIAYLDKKGIVFPDLWRRRGYKAQLKAKVKEVKEENPDFNAEAIARKYGHTILRLPPYHCEL